MGKIVNGQQKETLGKVLKYIKRYWGYLGCSVAFAAVTVALTLYLPILTGQAIDLIIDKGLVDFAGILAILKNDSGNSRYGGSTVDYECLQQ